MDIKAVIAWAIAHPELALVVAGLVCSIPGAIYAVVKTAYQTVTGKPAKGRGWTIVDVIVEALPNIPGAINRAVKARGGASIFAAPSSPSSSNPQSGRARVDVVALLAAVALCLVGLGAVLSGCPRLPPVVGCTPMAYRCTDDGRPQVCSSTQRWEPIGDESCAAGGAVCVVERTAHCAPMQITADGGSDAR